MPSPVLHQALSATRYVSARCRHMLGGPRAKYHSGKPPRAAVGNGVFRGHGLFPFADKLLPFFLTLVSKVLYGSPWSKKSNGANMEWYHMFHKAVMASRNTAYAEVCKAA